MVAINTPGTNMKKHGKRTHRHAATEREIINLQLLVIVRNLSTRAAVRALLAAAQEIVEQDHEVAP